jgi:hypothetical protein
MRPLLLLFLIPATLYAQHGKPGELLTAKHGAGGTWNLYMVSEKPLNWVAAQALAAGMKDPAGGTEKKGHLVTISSGAENQFVYHYVRGSMMWIGLTDNEKFAGASEAGSSPDKGWAWVTGEPLTWTNWQSAQPTDDCEIPNSKGEDAVAIEANGYWNDRSHGDEGQPGQSFPFLIEWDVQSKDPVPGARVTGAVLPAQWPALKQQPADDGKSPWLCVGPGSFQREPRMVEVVKLLTDNWDKDLVFRMESMHFQMDAGPDTNAFGWIFAPPAAFPTALTNCMLARARLVIPKAGLYTFNVRARHAFALRLGDRPWKSVHGPGCMDPCDPGTLYSLLMSADTDTRGIIDLPAGEIPVELLYLSSRLDGRLQILTAEGAHPTDGSTSQWRLLGHRPAEKVQWPGIAAEGWQVTIPPPGPERKITRRDEVITTLLRVDEPAAPISNGLDAIHFQDPECARRSRFPDPVPFPGDPPGPQDDRVILAKATLEIPSDGLYHLGITGDDLCALEISGKKWERLVRDSSGRYARIDEDSILCRRCDNNTSHEVIGEIRLTRGRYPLRAVSWDRNGASVMHIFAAPAGWPPRLLVKNGAKEEPDVPGLEVKPFQP